MGLLTDRDHDDPLIVTADIVENAEIPDAQQLPRSNRIVLQSLATSGRLIGLVRQLLGDGIDDDLLTALFSDRRWSRASAENAISKAIIPSSPEGRVELDTETSTRHLSSQVARRSTSRAHRGTMNAARTGGITERARPSRPGQAADSDIVSASNS